MNNFSLLYLIQLAWRRIWILLIAMIFFGATAYSYSEFFAIPSYSATSSVIVTNGGTIIGQQDSTSSQAVNGTDVTASLSLANTITDILKTADIFKEMSKELDGEYGYDQLQQMATIARRGQDTLFVDIKFQASSEKTAIELANTFVELAPDYIAKYVPYSNVAVAVTAHKANQVYPKTLIMTATAAIIGALLAFFIVLFIDSQDQAIMGEEDFTSNYDIPLLGSVPDFQSVGIISGNYSAKGGYGNGY